MAFNPATFWAKWKMKILLGVAVLAALGIAIFAAHHIGLQKGRNESKVAISQYEGKLNGLRAEVNKARAKVDTRVVTEYVTKREKETVVEYRNRDVIKTAVVSRDTNLSQGWVYAHNQAAKGEVINFDLAKIATPSIVKDADALDVVQANYARARRNAAKLEGLQEWARETEKAVEEVNRNRRAAGSGSVRREGKASGSGARVDFTTSGTNDSARATD